MERLHFCQPCINRRHGRCTNQCRTCELVCQCGHPQERWWSRFWNPTLERLATTSVLGIEVRDWPEVAKERWRRCRKAGHTTAEGSYCIHCGAPWSRRAS